MHASGTFAELIVLGCKASIAVMLLVAGGAKLADLAGFAATVRLFVPGALLVWRASGTTLVWRASGTTARTLAAAIAAGEILAGAASLSWPGAGWLNIGVLVVCCCFLLVWTVGYVRHSGRPCRCFGALSRRGFTAGGVGRAACLVLAATVATATVPPVAVDLSVLTTFGLLAGGALVALAAFSAAAVFGATAAGGGGTRRWTM